ncbi:Zinc carboxypeptidase [Papilio xuthus]|nr:Zinc carboxypeptidase [Papilio xuthus]
MLDDLLNANEVPCVENAEMGSTAITIYLKAIEKYCGRFVSVDNQTLTFQKRNLYEVLLKHPHDNATVRSGRPVILLEAGQQAGIEPVNFALFVIEQLVACKENLYMLKNARWVVLPSTNPDGREFTRYTPGNWQKNLRFSEDDRSAGVDISRNFDESFTDCGIILNGFDHNYPGKKPFSESETSFILDVLNRYKNKLRAYVSIRRDGHSLLYPFASVNSSAIETDKLRDKAAEITSKVNHKYGFIEYLTNSSIIEMNRKPVCGHSVDFVFMKYNMPYAYEMRVFLESDHKIMTKFQSLPRGYDITLRNGYFSVIKELYNTVVEEHRNRTYLRTSNE